MNYQSNLKKFESQLEKETNKLFKMYDQGKDLLDTEEQTEKVNNLKKHCGKFATVSIKLWGRKHSTIGRIGNILAIW